MPGGGNRKNKVKFPEGLEFLVKLFGDDTSRTVFNCP